MSIYKMSHSYISFVHATILPMNKDTFKNRMEVYNNNYPWLIFRDERDDLLAFSMCKSLKVPYWTHFHTEIIYSRL